MRRLLLSRALVALALALPLPLAADIRLVGHRWEAPIPVGNAGWGASVVGSGILADGTRLAVVANALGLRALQLDASGTLLGSALLSAPSYDGQYLVEVDPTGDVFVAGMTTDFWVMRFDGRTGAWIWKRPFVLGALDRQVQLARALARDARGDLFVAGYAANERGDADWAVVKLDAASGKLLWGPFLWDSGGTDAVGGLEVDASGDLLVAGTAERAGFGQFLVAKLRGSTGEVLFPPVSWRGTRGIATYGRLVLPDGEGGAVAAGAVVASASSSLWLAFRLSPNGAILWSRVFEAPVGAGAPSALVDDGRGAVLLAGTSGPEQVFAKLAIADGGLLWGPTGYAVSGAASHLVRAVRVTSAGNLLVAGEETLTGPTYRSFLYEVDGTTGAPRWGPVSLADRALSWAGSPSLLVGASGDPELLASVTAGAPPLASWIRIAESDGSVAAGERTFPADIPTGRVAQSLVGPDGNVVTLSVGRDEKDVTSRAVAAKLDGTTGAILWGPLPLATGTAAGACRIALDAAGDVLWAYGAGTALVYGKLRAADGAPLWGPASESPPAASVQLQDLAVDPSGDLLLLGSLFQATERSVVLKVAGATGALAFPPVVLSDHDARGRLFIDGTLAVTVSLDAPTGTGRVFRLQGATGADQWGPVTYESADEEALDGAGNLIRVSSASSAVVGVRIRKLSAQDGSTLFTAALPLPKCLGAWAIARRVLADAGGDLYLAATTACPEMPGHLEIWKLSGRDGAPVWGPWAFSDASSAESGAVDAAFGSPSELLVLGETRDETAGQALVVRLGTTDGTQVGRPIVFGGEKDAWPSAFAPRAGGVVVGLASPARGGAYVVGFAP